MTRVDGPVCRVRQGGADGADEAVFGVEVDVFVHGVILVARDERPNILDEQSGHNSLLSGKGHAAVCASFCAAHSANDFAATEGELPQSGKRCRSGACAWQKRRRLCRRALRLRRARRNYFQLFFAVTEGELPQSGKRYRPGACAWQKASQTLPPRTAANKLRSVAKDDMRFDCAAHGAITFNCFFAATRAWQKTLCAERACAPVARAQSGV